MQRIVLAYTGDLDTSIAIPWLAEQYRAEIVAATIDLGQGRELEAVRDRALASGAARAHVLDARDEFAGDYVLRALKAGAIYDDGYPMAAALSRPLIARKLLEIADIESAPAIAHGCTAVPPVRLEVAVRAWRQHAVLIAPARLWDMSASEQLVYAHTHGIAVQSAVRQSGTDTNLWGRSLDIGVLDDPRQQPDELFPLTNPIDDCPDEPATVELAFERGIPVAVNGVAMPFPDLIASLTTIVGAHGIGRVAMSGERLVGAERREICESPAAVVLHAAHRQLRALVTTRDVERAARLVSRQYADIVHDGQWFTPLRSALDRFVDHVQERVTGTVRLRLFKGSFEVVSHISPCAIDEHDRLARGDDGAPLDRMAAERLTKAFGVPFDAIALSNPRSPRTGLSPTGPA